MELNNRLQFAKDVARQAGEIMLKHFKIGVAHSLKSDESHVTFVDNQINDLVIKLVQETYPDDSILGEEGSVIKDKSPYTWVVDPVDGTFHYSAGVPTNTFMIALVQDGVPVFGVILDPYMKRLYSAIRGGGAFMNSVPIHVNAEFSLTTGRIALPGFKADLIDVAQLHLDAISQNFKTFAIGCVSYEGIMVATGQTAANVFPLNSPWDGAALKVIVEEAGGKVTDLAGQEQRYDMPTRGLIVSNGTVHDELANLIRSHLTSD